VIPQIAAAGILGLLMTHLLGMTRCARWCWGVSCVAAVMTLIVNDVDERGVA
jgi:hypothetical protein